MMHVSGNTNYTDRESLKYNFKQVRVQQAPYITISPHPPQPNYPPQNRRAWNNPTHTARVRVLPAAGDRPAGRHTHSHTLKVTGSVERSFENGVPKLIASTKSQR